MNKVKIYYSPLDPASRVMLMGLDYKGIEYTLHHVDDRSYAMHKKTAQAWDPSLAYIKTQDGQRYFNPIHAIEYLDDIMRSNMLITGHIEQRLEQKFNFEILFNEFAEKIIWPIIYYRIYGSETDECSGIIRKIKMYTNYASMRLTNTNFSYMCEGGLSCVDLGLIANISILEYLGLKSWNNDPDSDLKQWYFRMKSHKYVSASIFHISKVIKPYEKYKDLEL